MNMLAGRAAWCAVEDVAQAGRGPIEDVAGRSDAGPGAKLPAISTCQTLADLRSWLLAFARSRGFYGARYIHIGTSWWLLNQAEMPLRFLTTSHRCDEEKADWLVRDPAAARIRSAFAPFPWSTQTHEGLTDIQRFWLERERARGVAAGIAIPVQDSMSGPAYLSLFGQDEAAVAQMVAQQAPELAFIAAQFHALAKLLVKATDWAPELSEREIECLRLAALGKTGRESGQTLGLSNRTIEYHLRKASEKLGAATKTRAVVLAFGIGLTEI